MVASSGTGGTISGVGKFLKEKNPAVKIIGVDAFGSLLKSYHETGKIDKSEIYPYKIEGMGKNLVPSTTHFDTIDLFEKVRDKESAICSREIACKEGLFVGYTSGAVLQATKQLNDRKLFNKAGKFKNLPRNADYDCWLSLLKFTNSIFVNKTLFYYDGNHGEGRNYFK